MFACVRDNVARRIGAAGGVFVMALLLVAGAVICGIAVGKFVTAGMDVGKVAVKPIARNAVLQDGGWLSESYWRRRKLQKLRNQGGENPFSSDYSSRWDGSISGRGRSFDSGIYRTVCVRMCDGYYFPVSFSTTRDRFDDDEATCRSKCSSDARLFYYRAADGSPETMTDRNGRAYADIKAAFLYRTTYVKSCQCRPQPWSAAAKQRHAMYATKGWQKKARRLAKLEARRARIAARRQRSRPVAVRLAREQPGEAGVSTAGELRDPRVVQAARAEPDARVALPRNSRRFTSGRMSLGNSQRNQKAVTDYRSRAPGAGRWKKRWQQNAFSSDN